MFVALFVPFPDPTPLYMDRYSILYLWWCCGLVKFVLSLSLPPTPTLWPLPCRLPLPIAARGGLHRVGFASGPASAMAAVSAYLSSSSSPWATLPQPTRRPLVHYGFPVFGSMPSRYAKEFVSPYVLNWGKQRLVKIFPRISTISIPSVEDIQEYSLPTWAEFDLGRAPVFWKTFNGLPPTAGESLTLFYNPVANKLVPNDEFGIAFNGGFNQPIMCGGEPRVMTRRTRGKADPPMYRIKICVPKHAVSLIFSFTNGVDWDGPYRLQFQVLNMWRNKPLIFFNEGLAEELGKEGACDRAIFPDSNVVVTSCEIGSLYAEGGDRCNLNLVTGCMDPSSPLYDPLANVDDGSCPLESDSEE